MKLPPLEYHAVHKFVQDLAGEVLHPKQVDSLAHSVVGAIHSEIASITAIGRAAARAREVSEKHSIKQVDRLLANSKVDPFEAARGTRARFWAFSDRHCRGLDRVCVQRALDCRCLDVH